MSDAPKIKLHSCTLDCPEPKALGNFYAALLGWETGSADGDYTWVYPPGVRQGETPCLVMQRNPDYVPPVWPERPEAQQQMAHLDFAVADLDQAVRHAVGCGAAVAPDQFSKEWTVLFDPAGHPFCLCLMPHVFAENE